MPPGALAASVIAHDYPRDRTQSEFNYNGNPIVLLMAHGSSLNYQYVFPDDRLGEAADIYVVGKLLHYLLSQVAKPHFHNRHWSAYQPRKYLHCI